MGYSKERMKMRRPHVVPLSRQVLALLKEIKTRTESRHSAFIIPGAFRKDRPGAVSVLMNSLSSQAGMP